MIENSFTETGLSWEAKFKKGWWPLVAAGAIAAGNYFMQRDTNSANVDMANAANSANRDIANQQMRFQEQMSNTAHQREVKDLQAAGLNPTLSAGGNGSSTPSGASATMQAPQIQAPQIMDVAPLLIQGEQLKQNDQRIQIEKANSAAQIAKNLSETELTKMKKILAQKGMIRAELEGDAAQVIRNFMKYLKGSGKKTPSIRLNQGQ